MLIKLASLIASAYAMQVPGQVTLSNSWPSNDHAEAGGIWEFTIPADMIVNGTGSCSVSVGTVGLSFVHFFNAHVGQYNGLGTYEIYAVENWQAHAFEFSRNQIKFPQIVSCQKKISALVNQNSVFHLNSNACFYEPRAKQNQHFHF